MAKDKAQLIKDDWASFYSKDLFALILERFYSRPDLIRMEEKTKGIIIIGLKSLIESLERISQG